ncbi:MAG: septum formation inhibitor Maf [Acidobacteria bacterium]|nr:septum formation inhibitor Maf [Acidobacteriota bacterium]
MRLILASASPRRADLLRAAGFSFETIVTDVDEHQRPGETPSDYVRRLAAAKSAAALAILTDPAEARRDGDDCGAATFGARGTDQLIILGADTSVIVDGEVLGKPQDAAEAAAMLRRLSGRTHKVLTGISLRTPASEVGVVEATTVSFAPLSDAEVAGYVGSGEGQDKAGAYAIQGLASRFASIIRGSYSNVVGLPMEAVAALLPEIRQ